MNLKRKRSLLTCALMLSMTPLVTHAATTKPTPLTVGTTANVALDKDETKDYSVSLAKGSYLVVWDTKRADDKWGDIRGDISLLKPNGAIVQASLLDVFESAVSYRVGKTLVVAKPYVARFRIKSKNDGLENWFKIVPAKPAKFVPFGWGTTVTPARISSDNGVGGTLDVTKSIYHSITLPKGKWSISLGLSQIGQESGDLVGWIELLDANGFNKTRFFVDVYERDTQARKEAVLTVIKPTPYLLRVVTKSNGTFKYDVTIEPAS